MYCIRSCFTDSACRTQLLYNSSVRWISRDCTLILVTVNTYSVKDIFTYVTFIKSAIVVHISS